LRNDVSRLAIDPASDGNQAMQRGMAMTEVQVTATNTIADLLAAHPSAARVLVDHRMHCVGCDIAPFETIGDACAIYGINSGEFFADLRRAIETMDN
jgi:hybrid cluster-associated redox disulfide protein